MKYWTVPVTIIDHERDALIEAETKAEALQKLRENLWEELGDAKWYTVRKSGRIVEVKEMEK